MFPVRVYYEDTDAAGIVYYANYLKFAERARTEMMRSLGVAHAQLLACEGIAFAVRKCVAEYLRPARLDDVLQVRTRVTGVKGASLGLEQSVLKDAEELVRIDMRLACMSRSGRPARLPPGVRAALLELCNGNGRLD